MAPGVDMGLVSTFSTFHVKGEMKTCVFRTLVKTHEVSRGCPLWAGEIGGTTSSPSGEPWRGITVNRDTHETDNRSLTVSFPRRGRDTGIKEP